MLADLTVSFAGRTSEYDADIVIVLITDATMRNDARFAYISPVDRTYLAELIARIQSLDPAIIGLDVLLDRPTANDRMLAQALTAGPAPVVVASLDGSGAQSLCSNAPTPPSPDREGLNVFQRIPHGNAYFCVDPIDRTVRLAVHRNTSGGAIESFASVLARRIAPDISIEPQTLIRYSLAKDGHPPFASYDSSLIFMHADTLRKRINNRIVLIGTANSFHSDWHLTPLRYAVVPHQTYELAKSQRGALPGVVVHAYALRDILHGTSLTEAPRIGALIYIVLLSGAAAIIVSRPSEVRIKLFFLASLAAVSIMLPLFTFREFSLLVPLFTPLCALASAGAAGSMLIGRAEALNRVFVTNAFGHYIAPRVVNMLVDNPSLLSAQAERMEISAVFTDLEGFTSFVDETEPGRVQSVMNRYITAIVEVAHRYEGTVDKIVGDAVHIIFSAPLPQSDHRERAIRCALTIIEETEMVRRTVREEGTVLGRTRIGVHSGEALVGNFGGGGRFDFTAHGTTMNVAARLEAANKDYGTPVCVSECARTTLSGVTYFEIGLIALRGVRQPQRVYCPVGDADVAAALSKVLTDAEAGPLPSPLRGSPYEGFARKIVTDRPFASGPL